MILWFELAPKRIDFCAQQIAQRDSDSRLSFATCNTSEITHRFMRHAIKVLTREPSPSLMLITPRRRVGENFKQKEHVHAIILRKRSPPAKQ
jgi:hypothetical protein